MVRVSSAELVGVAEVEKRQLAFHKRSIDGSSKCNMINSGHESDRVYGVIYRLNHRHKQGLDRYEGNGYGYMAKQLTLESKGDRYACFTYLAQDSYIADNLKPYHWYKKLVVLGARYLGFPDDYVSAIEAVESTEDPDDKRRRKNVTLIDNIMKYGNKRHSP